MVEKKRMSEYEGKTHRGQTKIEKIRAVVNTQLLSHGPQAVKKSEPWRFLWSITTQKIQG